jgi:murein DD-endopeptidase MepM/ murein hydrolase activator NlpD
VVHTFVAFGVATVVAVPAARAQSPDPEASRRANQERQHEVDAQLNAATASEEQIRSELARLDGEVKAGEARVATAQQRQAEAEHQVEVVRGEVADAAAAVADARKKAADQAVKAYMRPDRESAAAVLAARDPQQLATMKALVGEVAQHNHAIVQARADAEGVLHEKQVEAEQAHQQAQDAAAQAQAELNAISEHRAQQASLRDEMLKRINQLKGEQAALDAEEAQISAILAERRRQTAGRSAAGVTAAPGRVSSSGLQWPASGPVTSGFGARWGTVHQGIDIGAPNGSPIWAAAPGEVFHAGTMSGYGNVVLIDHGHGMTTLYGHQSRIAASVGQQVTQGQVIGYVGSTGNSTGPHLHFEVRINDTPTDPIPYLP